MSVTAHCDDLMLSQYYKLNNDPVISKLTRQPSNLLEQERAMIDQLVVSLVAMKSVSA